VIALRTLARCTLATFGIGIAVHYACVRFGTGEMDALAAALLVMWSLTSMLIIILAAIETAGTPRSN
jgi:hypothetical protein